MQKQQFRIHFKRGTLELFLILLQICCNWTQRNICNLGGLKTVVYIFTWDKKHLSGTTTAVTPEVWGCTAPHMLSTSPGLQKPFSRWKKCSGTPKCQSQSCAAISASKPNQLNVQIVSGALGCRNQSFFHILLPYGYLLFLSQRCFEVAFYKVSTVTSEPVRSSFCFLEMLH